MTVRGWKDYSVWDWLISAVLAYWAWRFALWFTWLHELGHALLGCGRIISWNYAEISWVWFGADVGGLVVPIIVYGILGRLGRKLMPPLWSYSAMLAILIPSWNYWGDYPIHSLPHFLTGVAILAICVYNINKPGRESRAWRRIWPQLQEAFRLEMESIRADRKGSKDGLCRTNTSRTSTGTAPSSARKTLHSPR